MRGNPSFSMIFWIFPDFDKSLTEPYVIKLLRDKTRLVAYPIPEEHPVTNTVFLSFIDKVMSDD